MKYKEIETEIKTETENRAELYCYIQFFWIPVKIIKFERHFYNTTTKQKRSIYIFIYIYIYFLLLFLLLRRYDRRSKCCLACVLKKYQCYYYLCYVYVFAALYVIIKSQ